MPLPVEVMPPGSSKTEVGVTGTEDYLFIAGHHLSRASSNEATGDFDVAFALYKLGIDVLLKGVQSIK